MSDRELLEMAAKAAAYPIHSDAWAVKMGGGKESLYMGNNGPKWNPLINDGDAFRLFIKLNLWIQFEETIDAWEYCGIRASEPYGNDNNAAARRAIVRAAAEIGKAMQG